MATTQPDKRLRKKKKKPPKNFRLSYSLLLLLAMVIVGSVAGIVAYRFGKQALEGVNQSPAGVKLPKVSPPTKPKDSPKASPSNQDGKTSFLLDEDEVIAVIKAQSQQELGKLTRPAFVAKANISDRKKIYTRIEREYNALRDPLAVSANSDQRIAASIASLRQRVYTRSRLYDGDAVLERPMANNVSTGAPLVSKPLEILPIRSRWEDRDSGLNNSRQVSDVEVLPSPTSNPLVNDQPSSNSVEVNRR